MSITSQNWFPEDFEKHLKKCGHQNAHILKDVSTKGVIFTKKHIEEKQKASYLGYTTSNFGLSFRGRNSRKT